MGHAESVNGGQKKAALRKAHNQTQRIAAEQAEAASSGITVTQLGVRKWREWQAIYATWLREQRSRPTQPQPRYSWNW
jgi:hypothetical protein